VNSNDSSESPAAAARLHLLISGRVQGVCFRMYTCDEARHRGLTGWVRNLPDVRVEVQAEGPVDELRAFGRWCRHGPSHAVVRAVEETWGEASGDFRGFQIVF